MKKLLLAVIVSALLVLTCAATASAKTPTLRSLAKTVAALQKKVNRQAITITTLKSDLAAAKQTIAAQGQTIAAQGQALTSATPVLALAPYVSVSGGALNGVVGPNIVFQGANVHVRSSTAEADRSGLGNLIVGWNEVPFAGSPSGYRSGSNNLVCGNRNSFPTYGCFLAGSDNTAAGTFSSVSGGSNSTIPGANWATVSGGYGNTAGNLWATVSGGWNLTQSAGYGWTGGSYHTP